MRAAVQIEKLVALAKFRSLFSVRSTIYRSWVNGAEVMSLRKLLLAESVSALARHSARPDVHNVMNSPHLPDIQAKKPAV
jgi:hypothetical protein